MNNRLPFIAKTAAKSCIALALCSALTPASVAFADINDNRFEIGKTYNTGLDAGFWNENAIGDNDPHANWNLGQFLVSGYIGVENANGNNPTFIVAPGQTVSLLYRLDQDLDLMNNDPAISINWDENGSERVFGLDEREFGRGALFIESTVNGEKSLGEEYDFLGSTAVTGEEVEVGQFGDGTYRVSLDYEIREDVLEVIWISIFPSYTNYKDTFFFTVRTATEEEVASIAETGTTSNTVTEQSEDSTFDQDTSATAVELKREPWQLVVIVVASLIAGYMVLRSQWGPLKNWRKKKDKKD